MEEKEDMEEERQLLENVGFAIASQAAAIAANTSLQNRERVQNADHEGEVALVIEPSDDALVQAAAAVVAARMTEPPTPAEVFSEWSRENSQKLCARVLEALNAFDGDAAGFADEVQRIAYEEFECSAAVVGDIDEGAVLICAPMFAMLPLPSLELRGG